MLEQFQLEVKRKGKPIDPNKIDWENENLANFTFLQAPGPTNEMGKVPTKKVANRSWPAAYRFLLAV